MGMAHKADRLGKLVEKPLQSGVVKIIQIVENRFGWAPVDVSTISADQTPAPGAQPGNGVFTQHLPGPIQNPERVGVEPGPAFGVHNAKFMVAEHTWDISFANQIKDFFGLRAVSYTISQTENLRDVESVDIRQHGLKSGQIAVNVRNDGLGHVRVPERLRFSSAVGANRFLPGLSPPEYESGPAGIPSGAAARQSVSAVRSGPGATLQAPVPERPEWIPGTPNGPGNRS